MAVGGTVLVGADGSDPSLTALRWAARYAQQTSSALRVVWAWQPPVTSGLGFGYMPQEAFEMPADAPRKVQAYVTDSLAGAYSDLPVDAVVRVGNAAQVLLDESVSCDLLVIGRRGEGGFADVLIGSVSRTVSAHADVPVVVVPHPAS